MESGSRRSGNRSHFSHWSAKNVFVHKFVAIGTLEERIDEMIEDKKKLAGAIVGADESWLTELDNEAFKKLIALNQSAILE